VAGGGKGREHLQAFSGYRHQCDKAARASKTKQFPEMPAGLQYRDPPSSYTLVVRLRISAAFAADAAGADDRLLMARCAERRELCRCVDRVARMILNGACPASPRAGVVAPGGQRERRRRPARVLRRIVASWMISASP
jgi:hypothetical protein